MLGYVLLGFLQREEYEATNKKMERRENTVFVIGDIRRSVKHCIWKMVVKKISENEIK